MDRELKQATDHADSGRPDAAFHGVKALENTKKIISDENGWTTGEERGAASYLEHLVSEKNGRFLEVWEGDMMKAFFVHVRGRRLWPKYLSSERPKSGASCAETAG